jgi:hypothetical protein
MGRQIVARIGFGFDDPAADPVDKQRRSDQVSSHSNGHPGKERLMQI